LSDAGRYRCGSRALYLAGSGKRLSKDADAAVAEARNRDAEKLREAEQARKELGELRDTAISAAPYAIEADRLFAALHADAAWIAHAIARHSQLARDRLRDEDRTAATVWLDTEEGNAGSRTRTGRSERRSPRRSGGDEMGRLWASRSARACRSARRPCT
jgi:hypothetical protein